MQKIIDLLIQRIVEEVNPLRIVLTSTVTIQTDKGPKRVPTRPIAAHYFRGAQGHVNSGWTCLSIDMVNHIVGAADTYGD